VLELEVLEVLEFLVLEVLELEVLEVLELEVLEVLELEVLEVLELEVLEVLELVVLAVLELEVLEVLELLVLEVLELVVLEVLELLVLEVLELLVLQVLELEVLEVLELVVLEVLELGVLSVLELLAIRVLPCADSFSTRSHSRSLAERCEPESHPASPVRTVCRAFRPRLLPVPGTHMMALRPSSVPQRVALPSPPVSSFPDVPDPESDRARAASPTVTSLLATVVSDPSFDSTAASTLSDSLCPPSVGGELALSNDVLEDRQFALECLAAAFPCFASMLLCPEGDPDALDIPTPRSYAEAITGEYSSQWQTAMDVEMASWKSTGTYVDKVPPPGANIVNGMWIFRVKRPSGSLPAFKACYVARGFIYGLCQAPREWHDTLRTSLAALGFAPSTDDPSLFLRPDPSLPPFYILMYVDDLDFSTADIEELAPCEGGAAEKT
ncbi:unnamed protein product, partial [Closterium sp. NIES-54]